MIKMDASPKGSIIKLSIIDSDEDPRADRDRLLKLPNRKPIYDKGVFDYWEVPGTGITDVLNLFKEEEIQTNIFAKNLIQSFKMATTLLEDLPKYEGKLFQSLDGKVLKDFQEIPVRFSFEKKSLLLAMSPGLGKSLTACIRRATINNNGRTLMIVPRKIKTKWRADFQTYIGKDAIVYYHSTKKGKSKILAKIQEENSEIIIATFETAKDLLDLGIKFEFVIVDEAHIPGGGSAIYKTINRFMRENPDSHKWLMTGTPMRLTLTNLFDLIKLIDPIWCGRKSEFLRKFEKVEKKFRKTKRDRFGNLYSFDVPIIVSTINHSILREKLGSIMYRKTWEGLMDFENRVEIIPVEMTDKQTKIYYEILEEVRQEVRLNLGNPLTKMLRLLQIAEGTHTLFPEDPYESGKFKYLLDDLKDKKDQKACIFLRYLPGAKILHEKLKGKSIICTGDENDSLKDYAKWALNGIRTSEEEETFFKIKERYKLPFDPGGAQYIISTYSLRSGIGDDYDAASNAYFLSFDYSTAALEQARARIIRLSQENDCETQLIVSQGTTEPKSLACILSKLKNQKSILDGEEGEDTKTTQELVNILYEDF